MLEFALREIAEVVSGRKNFKTAAKSVGKQTLRKHLVEGEGSRRQKGAVGVWQGSRKNTTSRIIPTKSTKQSSWSRGDIFTNISRWTCRTTIFGTNLLWQCLEILEGKSQLLTMSCPRINNKSVQLPQLMKTAESLNFKGIGTYTLTWDSLFWHWSWNLSKDVVTILTKVRKRKRSTKISLLFSLKQAMTKKKNKKKLLELPM